MIQFIVKKLNRFKIWKYFSNLFYDKKSITRVLNFIGIFLFICLLTYCYLFKGWYSYGDSNQGELIPIHNRWDDDGFLTQDQYVNNLQEYNVRTNFAYVMYIAKNVTPAFIDYAEVYLIFHILITFFTFLAVYLISGIFSPKKLQKILLTFAVIFAPDVVLGGPLLFHKVLLPSSFSILFLLWALYFLWKKKFFTCLILVALSAYLHVLLGLLFGVIFTASIIFINGRNKLKKSLLILITYSLFALPAALPFILSTINSSYDSQQIAYIIGFFRNPHHYVPSTWGWNSIAKFFILQIIAILSMFVPSIRDKKHVFISLVTICALTTLMFFFGYFFVEIVTIPVIVKLQLFRISFLNDFLSRFLFFSALVFIVEKVFRKLKVDINKAAILISFIIGSIGLLFALSFFKHFKNKLDYEFVSPPEAKIGAYDWIKENTPTDATIITPISEDHIRLKINRAIIGNFKQFVFNDSHIFDWYERVKDLCGMEEPNCSGWECHDFCRDKFYHYNEESFEYLAQKYSAEYILTSKDQELDFEEVYKDEHYIIYKINLLK